MHLSRKGSAGARRLSRSTKVGPSDPDHDTSFGFQHA
jgi:hypothetical protein